MSTDVARGPSARPAAGRAGGPDGHPPIGDYALIGDCRAAALVSRDGSIDWLCFPRYDSPSIFGALLDARRGGRFRIRPTGAFRAERRYLPDTNVLETTFRTSSGAVVLRDLMPVASETEKRAALTPDHQVLREVEGLAGEVELEILYEPRPDYGRSRPVLRGRGALGLWGEARGAAFVLRSELPLELADDDRAARGVARIGAGERAYLSFTYTGEAPTVLPPLGEVARGVVERSARWWRDWAGRCTYQGPYREAVVRSALALKLMAYAPSGAVVAAPTTSLPERIGGERNWDYRYCWLRDASLTLRALFALGYDEEAVAFLGWMLHATRLTWPELQVLYDVFGEANLPETTLPHLAGYAGSRPVRVGNGAHGQLQLDVYGEVLDAVSRFARRGGRFDRDTVTLLEGLGQTVCRRWREPDEGIWEGRAGRVHHTHSKVLCWVALDRLVRLHEAGQIHVRVAAFRAERDAIRREVERRGYNERLGSYTRVFDGDTLDAALLTLPLYDYVDAAHPRMRATCARIHERLARGPLLYRYQDTDDGLPPGEGAFGICSFWAVECLARGGDVAQAGAAFEQLLTYANDVGLFAEEIDPDTGAALGNFPQAFTHVGLINAALTLAERRGERVEQARGLAVADLGVEDRA
ncbi:MAG TPA: glycoside hydrolase family 15 protein [Thermomicrobiales bacterium]|nr:glycoside hydrolase family 15 protein [Thermomicrobiales bacterium]